MSSFFFLFLHAREISKETLVDIFNSWRDTILHGFFSFCVPQSARGRCTRCRTGAGAYQRLQVQPGLWKYNRHLRLIDHVCMRAPTALEIRKRLKTLLGGDLTLQAPQREIVFFFFFFFFFAVDRTTNWVQTPSPRYESSFVCPRRVKFWDDPLKGCCKVKKQS